MINPRLLHPIKYADDGLSVCFILSPALAPSEEPSPPENTSDTHAEISDTTTLIFFHAEERKFETLVMAVCAHFEFLTCSYKPVKKLPTRESTPGTRLPFSSTLSNKPRNAFPIFANNSGIFWMPGFAHSTILVKNSPIFSAASGTFSTIQSSRSPNFSPIHSFAVFQYS